MLPIEPTGHQMVMANNGLVLCGGNNHKNKEGYNTANRCFLLNRGSDNWIRYATMNHKRGWFGMTTIKDEIFAVGGYPPSYQGTFDETKKTGSSLETINTTNSTAEWRYKKDLPVIINGHCVVPISETEIIAIGGYQKSLDGIVEDAVSLNIIDILSFPMSHVFILRKNCPNIQYLIIAVQ